MFLGEVYSSNQNSPILKLSAQSFKDLSSPGNFEGKEVKVTVGGEPLSERVSGGCFDRIGKIKSDPICSYAAQVYATARQAIHFYQSIGVTRKAPVIIDIQSAKLGGNEIADASLDTVRIRPFSAGELLPTRGRINDVVLHELTHVFQEGTGQKTRIGEDTRAGLALTEGYANLFAYLISGHTDLGKVTNGKAEMAALSRRHFGCVEGGSWYEAAQPFTSVMVQFHKDAIKATKGAKFQQELTHQIARAYFDAYKAIPNDAYYDVFFKNLIKILQGQKWRIPVDPLIKNLIANLKERGLDLDQEDHRGLTCGFLLNEEPVDTYNRHLERSARMQRLSTVRIKFLRTKSCVPPKFPVRVRVQSIGRTELEKAKSCLENEAKEVAPFPADREERALLMDRLQKKCHDKLFSNASISGDLEVAPGALILPAVNQEIELSSLPRRACTRDVQFAKINFYDADEKEVGGAMAPFYCGTVALPRGQVFEGFR
ncbi:MAG: hypothetical protein K2X47_15070 [Bdellovibrionales bacterium]|nr:hypothetical protein [Bdellovibrionales bacterium]